MHEEVLRIWQSPGDLAGKENENYSYWLCTTTLTVHHHVHCATTLTVHHHVDCTTTLTAPPSLLYTTTLTASPPWLCTSAFTAHQHVDCTTTLTAPPPWLHHHLHCTITLTAPPLWLVKVTDMPPLGSRVHNPRVPGKDDVHRMCRNVHSEEPFMRTLVPLNTMNYLYQYKRRGRKSMTPGHSTDEAQEPVFAAEKFFLPVFRLWWQILHARSYHDKKNEFIS